MCLAMLDLLQTPYIIVGEQDTVTLAPEGHR